MNNKITQPIDVAIKRRTPLIKAPHETAFRLINGFTEGLPDTVIEVFGKTVVYHDYSTQEDKNPNHSTEDILNYIAEKLPWIKTGVIKKRRSKELKERNGIKIFGSQLDKRIKENGVWYAIDLTMNRDASFYLDTKNLRKWIKKNLTNKSVLNTFAYTGSLGIAALAGGASEVMHLDLNKNFLTLARRSALLNGKKVEKSQYQIGDFWSRINQYKKNEKLFDCVILDPPVYAKTQKGIIDIVNKYDKIINKVRPIINDGGYLITINNALFQTGKDHYLELEKLCKDGYLTIETTITVPENCVGNHEDLTNSLPADPSPYNHSTKITILRVKKKK